MEHNTDKNIYDFYKNIYDFYKKSLKNAGCEVLIKSETKASKDVIGSEYELHRIRIYKKCGLDAKKINSGKNKTDLAIYNGDILVAYEEDKGHYMDLCFCQRALLSFAIKIKNIIDDTKDANIPYFIISSYTRYKLYDDAFKTFCSILDNKLVEILKQKVVYHTVIGKDRLSHWFGKKNKKNKNYYSNVNRKCVKKDIKFIIGLLS